MYTESKLSAMGYLLFPPLLTDSAIVVSVQLLLSDMACAGRSDDFGHTA
jgi:hypothetical protein